jgi:hypothetical protein
MFLQQKPLKILLQKGRSSIKCNVDTIFAAVAGINMQLW